MLAIDTNLIVRYLTGDHRQQSPKARGLINSEDVFVSTTVMLETEWVLRSGYGLAPGDVAKALTAFAGLAAPAYASANASGRRLLSDRCRPTPCSGR